MVKPLQAVDDQLRQPPTWAVWILKGLPWLFLAGFAAAYAHVLLRRQILLNSDFFSFIQRMEDFGTAPWKASWVNGLYPVGYPLLIKALFPIWNSYLDTAKWVSFGFAMLGLWAVWVLGKRVGGLWFGLVAMSFTGLNQYFLTYGTSEGTDMPATGLLLCVVALAASPSRQRSKMLSLGALIGFAYLIRYTALLALPALALAWLVYEPKQYKEVLKQTGWMVLAFLLVSSFQWVPSWIATGSPLYNTQYWNVWYALEGNGQWWRISTEATRFHGMVDVIQHAGVLPFLKNFFLNLARLVRTDSFTFDYRSIPVHYILLPGVFLLLWKKPREGLLIALVLASTGAAVSLAFLSPRVLLVMIPLEVIAILWPFALLAQLRRPGSLVVWVPVILMGGYRGIGWYLFTDKVAQTAYTQSVKDLPTKLRQAGMTDVHQVLCFSHNLYDVASPKADRYEVPWLGSAIPIRSTSEVAWLALSHGYRFVVTDYNATADIPGFKDWYKEDALMPPLVRIVKSPGVEGYAVPDSLQVPLREADASDWSLFCAGQPLYGSLAGQYDRLSAMVQERAVMPDTIDHLPIAELISNWRAYKGRRRLR